eukprot:jgi/Mesen1/4085/ME000214S03276
MAAGPRAKKPSPGKGGVLTQFSPEDGRLRAIAEIVSAMIAGVKEGRDINLNTVKSDASRKYGLARAPKLVEIIAAVPEDWRTQLIPRLRAKPVRTASGIAVVAVMSKPHRCPHIATTGNICVYCPGGPDSDFEYSTQSYTGYEPTSMRAIRARYNPHIQARSRIDQLRRLGHSVDKVVAHMMPDLPNVGAERDMESFHEFFESPCFRPDGLKLYPTLVIRGTGLYELWKTGRYRNYSPEQLVDLVARVLVLVPPWTRVYRIQRDIPMPLVTSGVEKGNLRELALARMVDLGLRCRDVRTREAGIQDIHHQIRPEEVELVRRDYTANGGWETFLAYEDVRQDILVGLLRLRKVGANCTSPELQGRCSMVRELHVYGTAVPVHARDIDRLQHQVLTVC